MTEHLRRLAPAARLDISEPDDLMVALRGLVPSSGETEPAILDRETICAAMWAAIERMASMSGLSVSGLALQAGFDAGTLNRSKRRRPTGGARALHFLNIVILADAAGLTLSGFAALFEEALRRREPLLRSKGPVAAEMLAESRS